MHCNRKRKHEVGSVLENVLQAYGHDKSMVANESGAEVNEALPQGRKQRRRNKKLLKKQNKQRHFQRLAKNHVSEKKQPMPQEGTKETPQPKAKKSKVSDAEKKKKALERENVQEDKLISALEKKFHLNKRKNTKKLPKSFVDSGLDYILDVLGTGMNGNKEIDASDDDEDNFFGECGKMTDTAEQSDTDQDVSDHPPSPNMDDDEDTDEGDSDNESLNDENLTHKNKNDVDEQHLHDSDQDDEKTVNDDDFNKSGKYIPPALRVKFSGRQEEEIRKLKRKVKGLFNRLSNANINSICSELEVMYRENSRAIMHRVLSEAILDQFAAPDSVPDSLVLETAMLVSAISARVAIEVLMHFYEVVTVKLHTFLTKEGKVQDGGKSANNLLSLLCRLYQLKSIDSKVIMDFFNLLIASFTEKDVELMLEILNKVGFQLRKDDPESLQDIVKKVTSKCEDLNIALNDGSRMAYMLSIMVAVKNNNVRKVMGYDAELIGTYRKKVASLVKSSREKSGSDVVPPVSLQDFLNADTDGRWWIVGSSFAGRPMLRDADSEQPVQETDVADDSVSKKFAEAAKKQRMNTDVRRKIFYAVMSADDFVDAFQKIIKCGFKGKQLREIAVVVVDCCQQEKKYNPYYLHLLNRFCQYDRQFVISLQCTLWDRFKLLGSLKRAQKMNVAELTAQLIVMEAVPVSCLKGIDFAEMDKLLVQFLRSVLSSIAVKAKEPMRLKTVFGRLSSSAKHKLVCQGLELFLRHFVLSDSAFMSEHSSLRESFDIMLSCVGNMNKTFM